MIQSPDDLLSNQHVIHILLRDISESLHLVTVSQYAKSFFLHIETTELISDNSELTLLFY